jgi:aminoglycoside phosphotransferase (APT) family kinase protein
LLAAGSEQLTVSLGLPPTASPVTRLAWVPQRRAVLRHGDVVVKLYADPAELRGAERALRILDGALPTAALLMVHADRGAVVQSVVGGRPLRRDDALRGTIGAAGILRQLHGLVLDGLDDLGPAELLAAAGRPTALAAFAVPELAERIAALTQHLAATMPDVVDVVPVHGDFNIGQLLADGDRTIVVDVDTLAKGSPAVDLAAYAANLHNGRSGDDEDMAAALTELVEAYGSSPPDLNWHLAATMLRRVDRPVRRLKKRWPDRVGAIVSAIEAVLRGVGPG